MQRIASDQLEHFTDPWALHMRATASLSAIPSASVRLLLAVVALADPTVVEATSQFVGTQSQNGYRFHPRPAPASAPSVAANPPSRAQAPAPLWSATLNGTTVTSNSPADVRADFAARMVQHFAARGARSCPTEPCDAPGQANGSGLKDLLNSCVCCSCCGARICSIHGRLVEEQHAKDCPQALLDQQAIWRQRQSDAEAEVSRSRPAPRQSPMTPKGDAAPKGSEDSSDPSSGGNPAEEPLEGRRVDRGSSAPSPGGNPTEGVPAAGDDRWTFSRLLDWMLSIEPEGSSSKGLGEGGEGLTDWGDREHSRHPENVSIDPDRRGRTEDSTLDTGSLSESDTASDQDPNLDGGSESSSAVAAPSPLQKWHQDRGKIDQEPPQPSRMPPKTIPVTVIQDIADMHLKDPIQLAPNDPDPTESIRAAAAKEGKLDEVDFDLKRARAGENLPSVRRLPGIDGAVATLKDEGRAYGPDQPLTTVVAGIGNSTRDNARFLQEVGEILPGEGVSGVFNVRPGDERRGLIDLAEDLGKAVGTRWPSLTLEQIQAIDAKHQLGVDPMRRAVGFQLPTSVVLAQVRVSAASQGKTEVVERDLANTVYDNQVRANPSIAAVQKIQEGKIRQNEEHRLIVHSEGEIIATAATRKTISNIENDPTLTPAQKQSLLANIYVYSLGGAGDSDVIKSFQGRIGQWTRYKNPSDPVPQIAARPVGDLRDDTPLGGVLAGVLDPSPADFSAHDRDAYMEFIKKQGRGFLLKNRGPRGQVIEIPIKKN